jgi:hypothetical protein
MGALKIRIWTGIRSWQRETGIIGLGSLKEVSRISMTG